jgi:hypothetical protein
MCFHAGFLRFNPPLCKYLHRSSTWDLQFSSASQLGASTRKRGSWLMLGDAEPSFKESRRDEFSSFKEFLSSPAMICLGVVVN